MIREAVSLEQVLEPEEHLPKEGAVRESDSVLRSFYDSASMMMGIIELLDDDVLLLSNNASTARFFGCTTEELANRRVSELGVPAEHIQRWLAGYRESELLGTPVSFEYAHTDSSGTRWLSATVCPISPKTELRPRFCYIVEEITERKQADEELARNRRLFQQIAEATPNVLFLHDFLEGRNIYANPAVTEMLGYTPEQLAALGAAVLSELMHPDDLRCIEEVNQRIATLADGEVLEHEYRLLHADGRYRWFVSRDTVFSRLPDGRPHQILGVAQDITERKDAESALHASEERLRRQNAVLVDLAQSKLHNGDLETALRVIMETAAATLEVERTSVWLYNDERSSICCADLYERDRQTHSSGLELAAADYPTYFRALQEERIIAADDARNDPKTSEFSASYLCPLGITSMLDAPVRQGSRMVGVVCHEHVGVRRDWTLDEQNFARSMADMVSLALETSERKRAEEMVRWQAYHDSLTRLPNRLQFQNLLAQSIKSAEQEGREAAVLFVDLDRFKQINDTLGHETGDTLLQIVARRLSGCLRNGDMVARLGGDEFTLLLTRVAGPQEAITVASRIMQALRQPVSLGGLELSISASIGISLFPSHGRDAQTLLRHSDIAMYQAKEQGCGGYQLFTEAMTTTAFERLVLETRLRKALEAEELILYYQPQIEVATGRTVGVEALIRWQHPEHGLVPPGQFIPLAEETGLIHPMGEWVLGKACRKGAKWQEIGVPLRVAVNVSACQFRRSGFVAMIRDVLAETGMLPQKLELELTETALIQDNHTVLETLYDLKELGVRLAVDDFGTGYSSLSYLRRLPFDVLKVDHSFVHSVAECSRDYAVVRALIQMAHALGLEVVAEGVETAAQRDCLAELGCQVMQGSLLQPALTVGALEVMLGQNPLTPTSPPAR
jgi:diguanylate cyclase (GGDEF)-like protein/PAS domain S-box-containing protein